MLRSTRPMPMCSLTKKISIMIQGVAGCPVRVDHGREQVVVQAYPSHEPGATLAMVVLILEGSSPDVDCRFHKRIQMPGFDPQQVNYAHRTTCDTLDHYRNFLL